MVIGEDSNSLHTDAYALLGQWMDPAGAGSGEVSRLQRPHRDAHLTVLSTLRQRAANNGSRCRASQTVFGFGSFRLIEVERSGTSNSMHLLVGANPYGRCRHRGIVHSPGDRDLARAHEVSIAVKRK
jgi:hypothetical protein